jgi:hypothetical protein
MEPDRPAMKLIREHKLVLRSDEPNSAANQNSRRLAGADGEPRHRSEIPYMMDKPGTPETVADGTVGGSRQTPVLSDTCVLIQSLHRLRERVQKRLDALEILAREQISCGSAVGDSTGQARSLELKRAELEEAERQICARAERQEKDWTAAMTKLEADRRLLAEAWERVERERVAHSGAAETHDRSCYQGPGRQQRTLVGRPHADALAEPRSATAESDSADPVPPPSLRQYETLCSDVRRNAVARSESR